MSKPHQHHISPIKDSRTPTSGHPNTPSLQHSSTPTLQHSSTPALQHSDTPAPRHTSTSVIPYFSRLTLFLAVSLLTLAGCQRALSVIFDLPPKQETQSAIQPAQFQSQSVTPVFVDTLRPPIEEILIADSVKKMLPTDHAGNIDWMAAMRNGTIKPRDSASGQIVAAHDESFQFGFDFFFEGPAPTFDAYFPHSAHTQWVNCQQCHGRIFKYRDTEFQMADVLNGQFCGECHGKVSFPPVTGCERCHLDLPQAPNRAQPDLLGTIRMTRIGSVDSLAQSTPADSSAAESSPTEVLITDEGLPPAVFPHWVHRIRYTCKACHMELFEPKAGANIVTMQDISAGEACGTCHNGEVAFDAGFGSCQRCHVPLGAENS